MRKIGDRVDSQLLPELYADSVARLGERLAKRQRAEELAIGILRTVNGAVGESDRERGVLENSVWRDAVGDCERIHDWLERRSGLPHSIDGTIELRVVVIASAYERAHIAGGGIERHHHALEVVGEAARFRSSRGRARSVFRMCVVGLRLERRGLLG